MQLNNYLKQINKTKLEKKPLLKNKIKGLNKTSGRGKFGTITVNHKGGGHKRRYRKIDFYRQNKSIGITCSIEYDPNRNCYISAIYNLTDLSFYYILTPKNLRIGDIIKSNYKDEPKIGHSLRMEHIPIGSYVHNVSIREKQPSKISRSAGTFSKLKEKNLKLSTIELSSGSQKTLSSKCFATIGIVSNEFAFLTQLKKAGQARWLGVRPSVRGVAMNPVDHPHGGGEGRKSGKNKTPWGKPNRKKSSK